MQFTLPGFTLPQAALGSVNRCRTPSDVHHGLKKALGKKITTSGEVFMEIAYFQLSNLIGSLGATTNTTTTTIVQ